MTVYNSVVPHHKRRELIPPPCSLTANRHSLHSFPPFTGLCHSIPLRRVVDNDGHVASVAGTERRLILIALFVGRTAIAAAVGRKAQRGYATAEVHTVLDLGLYGAIFGVPAFAQAQGHVAADPGEDGGR